MLPILLLVSPSLAATLAVSSSGTYTTIQSAINAASSGDTITVAAGTYKECLDTKGKNLTIQGAGSTTRLTGSSCTTGALRITTGETVSFSGFRVENTGATAIYVSASVASFSEIEVVNSGVTATSGAYKYGGGMYVTASYVDISDSTFDGNKSDYGGAIAAEGGTALSLVDVVFEDNKADNGGAIYAEDDGTVLEMEGCTFTKNGANSSSSGKGGAIRLYNAVELWDDGSTFEENFSVTYGGAIEAESYCEVTLENTVFDGNYGSGTSSITGGAIYASKLDELYISGAEFVDNEAYYYGGAIHADSLEDAMVIEDSTFSGNTVKASRGGAIEASNGSDVYVVGSRFEGNTSPGSGAAISVYSSIYGVSVLIEDSTFEDNVTTSTRDAYGGAVFVYTNSTSGDLEISGCTFEDNTAALSGGAVYTAGIYDVTITDSTFEGNAASGTTSTTGGSYAGGAVNIYDADEVVVSSNVFCGNTSDEGGGLYLGTVLDLSFANNILVENEAASGDGGNLFFSDVEGEVVNNNVLGGSASGSGGAAYFEAGSTLEVVNTVFAYSASGGGVYAADAASATGSSFAYSDWYSNTGYDRGGSFSFSTASGGNITSVPAFTAYSVDGNCGNDDFVLASTSALIDAGDSSIKDPDGSRSDIGAYGGPDSPYYDGDGDGSYNRDDCDDDDASVYPGASETCDGADDDCDGTIDEDSVDGTAYYTDSDRDGYGATSSLTRLCSAASGYTTIGGDCDDADSGSYPGAPEYCNGDDDDCDGTTDEDAAVDATTWYGDVDGDSYGGTKLTKAACSAPSGYVSTSSDCDDADSGSYPGAPEYCNGDDDDCDGTTDEDAAVDATTWYYDDDSDGYGGSITDRACAVPSGYVAASGDCSDANAAINPGAAEVCDSKDNDCDGTTDGASAAGASTYYADGDGDGYGDGAAATVACAVPGGHVADDSDCDDSDSDVNPGETEVCDALDNDCDGSADGPEAVDAVDFYRDSDGDSYGDEAVSAAGCLPPSGYVLDDTDCEDGEESVHPEADELCDAMDNDCDGATDEDAVDAAAWFLDEDEDGYGAALGGGVDCEAPRGSVTNDDDCDDTEADANPDEPELPYDGVDNDCTGGDLTDADGDGYDADYVGGLDCDDDDAAVHPGAGEDPADGIDSDCDGEAEDVGGGDPLDGDGSGGKDGCSHAGAGAGRAGLWGLLALIGAAGSRRRRPVLPA